MNITYFFAAAAIGFVLMASVTVQALEALTVTIKLIAKAKQEDEGFRVNHAKRRVRQVCILLLGVTALICISVITFANDAIALGFMAGFVVAVPCCYQRFQVDRPETQERFRQSYLDCYSDFNPTGEEAAPAAEEAPSFDTGDDDEVVPVSRPR